MDSKKHWYCCFINHSLCPRQNRDFALTMGIFTGLFYILTSAAIIFSPYMPIDEKIGSMIAMSFVIGCAWICFVIPSWSEWSCYSDEEKEYMEKINRC